ncbi:hypothetical protein J8L98_20180 [Pseudoalteromonas sp. MMG013]|uniref:hypothetical protein n=1 Tax=Pseudoalteromonas sp. MMG013 TaxID=2822687 RepID=UPI001B364771|nr:hypothetical protein [Pseudoalteromonas sp. MMG013]MBQ4864010.1 hypothetical protein [Pseudoalteromonas sp. MMG013]
MVITLDSFVGRKPNFEEDTSIAGDGEYREDFIPQVLLKSADIEASGNDVAMQKAFAFFK